MNSNEIQIRNTTSEDFSDIISIHKRAFGYDGVADLTAALLEDVTALPMVSLLAVHDGKPVGHILFTKATLDGHQSPAVQILAPLAVIPEYQKKGIGGLLIEEGLRRLREMGTELVFVLGHNTYYPRHGFLPHAVRLGYPAPYPIPEQHSDCWMVQPLTEKGFDVGRGKVHCSAALDAPEHWRE